MNNASLLLDCQAGVAHLTLQPAKPYSSTAKVSGFYSVNLEDPTHNQSRLLLNIYDNRHSVYDDLPNASSYQAWNNDSHELQYLFNDHEF